MTSASFAFWLGANIIKRQSIPKGLYLDKDISGNIKNLIIHNKGFGNSHSIILLQTL